MNQREKRLDERLKSVSHDDMLRWLSWIVAIGASVLTMVFAAYFLVFATYGASTDSEDWGLFGDFVGGTANPILSFLTLIALALTIVLQSKQLAVSSQELQLSRRELELTRTELHRSARAQELSEQALRSQAEAAKQSAHLTAINFLLARYQADLAQLRSNALRANDPRLDQIRDLENREQRLLVMLDELFRSMTQERQ
jgi:fumarate reductase subunit C